MKTERLIHPPEIGRSLVPALAIICTLTIISDAEARAPKNRVVATVNVGNSPGNLVCSPDNNFVYVTVSGGVAVIDAGTNQLSTNFPLSSNQTATGLAISPDGQTLYTSFVDISTSGVQVISVANGSVTETIPVQLAAQTLAITPDGTHLWVCGYPLSSDPSKGGIYVIDTATFAISGPITLGPGVPGTPVFTPDGADAFAISSTTSVPADLVEMDASTLAVLNPNVADKGLHGKNGLRQPALLSTNPDGKTLYVWEQSVTSQVLAVTISNSKTTELSTTDRVACQAITPDGKFLYLVSLTISSTHGKVTAVSTATGTVTGRTVTAGAVSTAIAIRPDGKFAYVANSASGTVTVIDIQP
jgi:DNA-binding beta-propeller fold protein YncE